MVLEASRWFECASRVETHCPGVYTVGGGGGITVRWDAQARFY